MEPTMKRYIDPREATFRPSWTQSHGSSVDSGNYVSPTQAVDIQYGRDSKDAYAGAGVPMWVRNRTILPKIIIPNKTGIEGRSTPNMPGMDSVRPITNAYARYPINEEPAGATDVPVPDVYASGNVVRYSSPFTAIKDFFGKIWWAIKLFFIRIFSKIGLYKGMIPINPYTIPEYIPDTTTTTPKGIGTMTFDPQPYFQQKIVRPSTKSDTSQYYGSEPFYNHTVIFSQEVLP